MKFKDYQSLVHLQCQQLQVPVPDDRELEFGFRNHLALLERATENTDLFYSNEFIQMALYASGSGYYVSGRQLIGEHGDFVTAPELCHWFGASIAHSVLPVLRQTETVIYEFGAGSGRLAAQILQYYERVHFPLRSYRIIEVSPSLQALQKETLEKAGFADDPRVEWLCELPEEGLEGCIIGNELLDAIPAHRFVVKQGEFLQSIIEWEGNQFVEKWTSQCSLELKDWLQAHGDRVTWQENTIYEASPWRSGWIANLSRHLKRGACVLLDYGYSAEEFFHPLRRQGTLKCFYQHHQHEQFTALTGLQDITSHVNFSELCFAAEEHQLELMGFCSQAEFLMANNLLTHATQEPLHTNEVSIMQRRIQSQNLQKLLSPGEMGDRIKVIAFGRGIGDNARPLVPGSWVNRL